MRVLSLFDGMSCGRIALERAGVPVEVYYSSEVDPYAIKVANYNYPVDGWNRLGDVRYVDGTALPKIDLLIGGSPCQSFSFAGKRKGMSTKCDIEIVTLEQYMTLRDEGFEFQGQSYLFWEYMRILHEIKPKYFFLENVVMNKKWEKILTEAIGVEPIMINSSLVSAQNRKRLYWTNIPRVTQPQDRGLILNDVLEDGMGIAAAMRGRYIVDGVRQDHKMKVAGMTEQRLELREDRKMNALTTVQKDTLVVLRPCEPKEYDETAECHHVANATDLNGHDIIKRIYGSSGKSPTLTANQGGNQEVKVSSDGLLYRKLTPLECERLQTVPDNYTSIVSNSQRYKMLGNGWTVDVIAHIFKNLL